MQCFLGNANNLSTSSTPTQTNITSSRSISPQSNASPVGSNLGHQPSHSLHNTSSSGSLAGGSTTPTSAAATSATSQPQSLVSSFKSSTALPNAVGATSTAIAGTVIPGGIHQGNESVGVKIPSSNMPGGLVTPGTPISKAKVSSTII